MKIGTNTLLTTLNHVNIDAFYGPYTSEEEALRRLNGSKDYRELGLTVGIYKFIEDEEGTYYLHRSRSNSYYDENIGDDPTTYSIAGITEYWFQWNDTKTDLVLSQKGILVKLTGIRFTAEADENNTVTVSYTPEGNSIFALNSVSIYRDNVLLTVNNFKERGDTFSFEKVPEGSYIYKILIVDIFGLVVTEQENVRVGTIKVTTENILRITTNLDLINKENIKGIQFGVKVLILDPAWQEATFGIYADNDLISGLQFVSSGDNLKVCNVNITEDIASAMDGHIIYVRVSLNTKTYEYELFKVLSSSILFVSLNETKIPAFYPGNITPVKFTFMSGARIFNITSDTTSDYSFASQDITFDKYGMYNTTLYITPKLEKVNSSIVFSYGENKTVSVNLGNIVTKPETSRFVSWDNIPNNGSANNCYIDFTGVITPNRENNDGVIIKFNDKMYITNDVIHVNDIEVATPLNELVYVGMGFGLKDINPNIPPKNGESYHVYDCICINGTIVKISKSDIEGIASLNPRTNLPLSWNSLKISYDYLSIHQNNGHLCTGFWLSTDDSSPLLLFANNEVLCEENYLEDGFNERSKIIPTLYLEVIDNPEDGTYDVWKKGFRNVSFGKISDGFDKYTNSTIVGVQDDEFKLLKISEDNKKLYLKICGVVCKYYYTESDEELSKFSETNSNWSSGIVTVYTQGTSTLKYALPNFKFYFAGETGFTIKYSVSGSSDLKSVTEKVLTAKADYMESSHLNNTPTAMLYNEIVKDTNIIPQDKLSPSIQDNLNDAIVGVPIRLMIKDRSKNGIAENYVNYGSFMLNTDKTSSTLGFETSNSSECISFEGTSNYENDGIASRFLTVNDATVNIDTLHIDLSNYTKELMTKFLSHGFEYRYPEGLEIDEDMNLDHYDTFLDMWTFVANSTKNTDFSDKFNLDYCYLYIIFMIVFGQTDNLGKNCMFDCWKTGGNWGKWFPRPYDLDSQCGLNNNGLEYVPPFVLVSTEWIPDDRLKADEIFESSHTFKYKYMPNSKIFNYSSATSKLWENIYVAYQDNIDAMYAKLRGSYFNYNTLIEHYLNKIIDKISIHLYNIDFLNKYLGSAQQSFMLGNRWTNFKDWLRDRLAFCDGYFKYKKTTYRLDATQTVNINYIFPAYCIVLSGDTLLYYFGPTLQFTMGGGVTQPALYLSDSLVETTNLYNNNAYKEVSTTNQFEFTNLKTLTLGGSVSPLLSGCKQLSKLTITNTCTINSFDIPNNILELICNAPIQILNIAENSLLRYISLRGATLDSLNLTTCPRLKTLILDSCEIQTLTLGPGEIDFTSNNCKFQTINLDALSVIKDLDLSNQFIHNLNLRGTINRLDLFKTNFIGDELDNSILPLSLTNVLGITTLNLIGCNVGEVKVGDNTFGDSLKLGVLDSLISKFGKVNSNSEFIYNGVDLTVLPSNVTSIINYTNSESRSPISSIYSLSYDKANKEYKGKSTEQDTKLKKMEELGLSFGKTPNIINARVKSGVTEGCCLFAQCSNLKTITTSSGNATLKSDWVFYGCTSLNSLTRIKINKFRGAFVGTILPYSTVENLIEKSGADGDFSFFYCLARPTTDKTINIDGSKYPPISRIDNMFRLGSYSAFLELEGEAFTITMTNPFTITDACKNISLMFDDCSTITTSNSTFGLTASITLPTNFLVDTSNNSALGQITTANRTFRGCKFGAGNAIEILGELSDISSAMGMFENSSIIDNISSLALSNTKLSRLEGMFLNAKFSSSVKIDDFIQSIGNVVEYSISERGMSNRYVKTLMLDNCFMNCKEAYIESDNLNINANIDCVYINGFLGFYSSSYATNSVPTKIVFNQKFKLKGETGPEIIRVSTGGISDQYYANYCGPFSYRTTNTSSITLDCTDSENTNLNYYLKGIRTSNSGKFTVTIINPTKIIGICEDASNIDVTFSTTHDCVASSAFKHCTFTFNYDYDLINLTNITDASKMFAASNIEQIDFVLPSTLTKANSMFNRCMYLKSGLPLHFFDLATNLKDVSRMFYQTKIACKLSSDTNRSDNISLPNWITTAEGTFAAVNLSGESQYYSIVIDCSNLTEMSGIFASSDPNMPILINSIGYGASMNYAFANREVPDNYQLWISNISSSTGMFFSEDKKDTPASNYPDLLNLSNNYGIFYNWFGDTTPSLKLIASYEKERRIEDFSSTTYVDTYII